MIGRRIRKNDDRWCCPSCRHGDTVSENHCTGCGKPLVNVSQMIRSTHEAMKLPGHALDNQPDGFPMISENHYEHINEGIDEIPVHESKPGGKILPIALVAGFIINLALIIFLVWMIVHTPGGVKIEKQPESKKTEVRR